jgi:hypothetical protein
MANTSIASISNVDLWERWKQAIDNWALEPRNRNLQQRVDRLEEEIVNRLAAVGHSNLKADFVAVRPVKRKVQDDRDAPIYSAERTVSR